MEIDLRINNGTELVDIYANSDSFVFKATTASSASSWLEDKGKDAENEEMAKTIGFEVPKFLDNVCTKGDIEQKIASNR